MFCSGLYRALRIKAAKRGGIVRGELGGCYKLGADFPVGRGESTNRRTPGISPGERGQKKKPGSGGRGEL